MRFASFRLQNKVAKWRINRTRIELRNRRIFLAVAKFPRSISRFLHIAHNFALFLFRFFVANRPIGFLNFMLFKQRIEIRSRLFI